MRWISLLLITLASTAIFSQRQSGRVWTQIGVKGAVSPKLDWSIDVTNRFGSDGLETFFTQASLKYKLKKWIRPSLDYRSILDKDKYKNYTLSHRLNVNADFKKQVKRFSLGARLRYQYSFQSLQGSKKYDAEFDQAIRIKPHVAYDIKKSGFGPLCSIEYFYNPTYSELGQRFTKYRLFIGTQLELNGPHELAFGYMLDREINTPNPDTKHILSISYSYNLSAIKRKDDKTEKKSGGNDLFNE
ncbi:MAG: DUF2490 domain-containing protein [Flavobacteriia bacterium]|jgi:hypothetical protein